MDYVVDVLRSHALYRNIGMNSAVEYSLVWENSSNPRCQGRCGLCVVDPLAAITSFTTRTSHYDKACD
jgi:hypothetical protein